MKKSLLFAVIFLAANSFVLSAPFNNYTGLIHVPSAYTLGDQMVEAVCSADAYRDSNNVPRTEIDGRISVGFERIEIGLTILTERVYTLNFKLNFLSEDVNGLIPAAAWGVRNISSESRITSTGTDSLFQSEQNNSIFLVLSKRVNVFDIFSVTGHLGIGSNAFRGETPLLRQLGGTFFGFEIPFAKYFSFMAEIDGRSLNTGLKANYYGVTLGLTVSALDRLRGAQTTNAEAEGLRFGVGLILKLDFSKPAPYGLWEK